MNGTTLAELTLLEIKLRDYYSKYSFNDALTVRVLSGAGWDDIDGNGGYKFAVELYLTSPKGYVTPLAYESFLCYQNDKPDMDDILKTLNGDINRRIQEARTIANLCPKRVGGKK